MSLKITYLETTCRRASNFKTKRLVKNQLVFEMRPDGRESYEIDTMDYIEGPDACEFKQCYIDKVGRTDPYF